MALYAICKSWRVVQRQFHPRVPFGTLNTIARTGDVPKKWRRYFGLVEYLPAPACPHCGEIHLKKSCPKGRIRRSARTLWDWPVEELRKALENRKEV